MTDCVSCGSNDIELYEGERSEPDVLHCHDCGHDHQLRRNTADTAELRERFARSEQIRRGAVEEVADQL